MIIENYFYWNYWKIKQLFEFTIALIINAQLETEVYFLSLKRKFSHLIKFV